MKELIAALDRIATALESYNKRTAEVLKTDYDAKIRKRGRLLLEIENDKRFPDMGTRLRNPENHKLPITDFVVNWLSDEAKDAAAVLDYLLTNPEACARIGYSEDADAKRQLEAIDSKLFQKSAPQATEALRSIFGKREE